MAFRKSEGWTETRFWRRVRKTERCWLWVGLVNEFGYGCVRIDGKTERAHRVSWQWANGPIPEGLCVLHRCDVPSCVRPDHLFLGTKAENTSDMMRKGRGAYEAHSGESAHNAVLTWVGVEKIRSVVATTLPRSAERHLAVARMASLFNISRTHVRSIVKEIIWKRPRTSSEQQSESGSLSP